VEKDIGFAETPQILEPTVLNLVLRFSRTEDGQRWHRDTLWFLNFGNVVIAVYRMVRGPVILEESSSST
jgi:hypothetical protein